jgi:CheY-like chemotaxis protein
VRSALVIDDDPALAYISQRCLERAGARTRSLPAHPAPGQGPVTAALR